MQNEKFCILYTLKKDMNCTHPDIIVEQDTHVCTECGEEVSRQILPNKEWRFYGAGDTKHSSEPNRVQLRKTDEKGLFKDVENLGFTENIVSKANEIYMKVTGGKILRGMSRKGIVFACIYHAHNDLGTPKTYDRLVQIFGIDRKTAGRGIKSVFWNSDPGSLPQSPDTPTITIIEEIMNKFQATAEQKKQVIELYNKIKNRSCSLNQARPKSVASGLVFYWIRINGNKIGIKDFIQNVSLSELTVNKIVKEISGILSKNP